jgi:hypothetical protein
MTESITDLEKRRNLLKEIKELSDSLPSEDEMEAVHSYHAALIEIEKSDAAPSEDEMKAASDHLATLKEIEATEVG